MHQTRSTDESLRQVAQTTGSRRSRDPVIGMVAELNDAPAHFERSGRHAVQRADPIRMLGELATEHRPKRRERRTPYLRLAVCFVGFIAVDAAIIVYVLPKWRAIMETPTTSPRMTPSQPAQRNYPYTETLPDGAEVTHVATRAEVLEAAEKRRQERAEIVHRASTLADGLRCAGGLVYKSEADATGSKVITAVMDSGKPVRCQ